MSSNPEVPCFSSKSINISKLVLVTTAQRVNIRIDIKYPEEDIAAGVPIIPAPITQFVKLKVALKREEPSALGAIWGRRGWRESDGLGGEVR
jgi:hypothetical protein